MIMTKKWYIYIYIYLYKAAPYNTHSLLAVLDVYNSVDSEHSQQPW